MANLFTLRVFVRNIFLALRLISQLTIYQTTAASENSIVSIIFELINIVYRNRRDIQSSNHTCLKLWCVALLKPNNYSLRENAKREDTHKSLIAINVVYLPSDPDGSQLGNQKKVFTLLKVTIVHQISPINLPIKELLKL